MAFKFPRSHTKAGRRIRNNAAVTHDLENWRDLPTVPEAKVLAKASIDQCAPILGGWYIMALNADDSVSYYYSGPRGGWREIWHFGKADT